MQRLLQILFTTFFLAAMQPSPMRAQPLIGPPELASINQAGTAAGDRGTDLDGLSADGRYVLLRGRASDLTSTPDTNSANDVFLRDLQLGVTELISINTAGTAAGNSSSILPSVSADASVVAFESDATDLVASPSDTNNREDLFGRDRVNNATELVSVNAAGTDTTSANIGDLQISANGGFVAWITSDPFGLTGVPDGNGFFQDLVIRDLGANVTEVVNINLAGTASSNGIVLDGFSLSADGSKVAFASTATDLTANGSTEGTRLYVRDRDTDTTELVSVGSPGTDPGRGEDPILTPDGRFVVFEGAVSITGFPNPAPFDTQVYRRELVNDVTIPVSVNSVGDAFPETGVNLEAVSDDGNRVLFISEATDLIPGANPQGLRALYLRDVQAGVTKLVSVNSAGTAQVNSGVSLGSFSGNGRWVFFETSATDVVAGLTDTNAQGDLFARDLDNDVTYPISLNLDGSATQNGAVAASEIETSFDGLTVAYASDGTDDTPDPDSNNEEDIFVVRIDLCIDRADVAALVGRLRGGTARAGYDDFNNDGRLNIADARALALQCTQTRCAPCTP